MKKTRFISVFLSLALLLTLSLFCAAAAEGSGDGSGNGSQNKGEVNRLQSSSIVDGDSNISTQPVIELVFSSKVDDITVLSANKDCFHLQDTAGTVQTLEVLFPDTQVQNRYQHHVFLIPSAALAAGQEYTLTIDAGVADKKGHTMGQSLQINFTTATDETYAVMKENEDLLALGADVLTYNTSLPPSGNVSSSDAAQSASDTDASSTSGPSARTIILAAVPVLLLLLAGMFCANWKKSKEGQSESED